MNTYVRAALVLALLAVAAIAAGCSSTGSESGDSAMKVWGYVVSADRAQLKVADTASSRDSLTVEKVVSPGPAWLVVHLEKDGMPGDRVGLLHVDEGVSSNLDVPLDAVTGKRVIVALHADKGSPDEFDFDMMNKEMSPDRPYFVEREELARVVAFAD